MTKKKLTFEDLPAAMMHLLEDVAKIKKMLKAQEAAAKKAKPAASPPEPKPEAAPSAVEIGIEKASELLKRSKQAIYALVRSGALAARKQGSRLVFSMDQLVEYADRHKKAAPKRAKTKPAPRSRKPIEAAPPDVPAQETV